MDGESRFDNAAIGYTTNIHPTVRRRVILITEGAAEVTVGSGEARILRPGDTLEASDCEGRGHVVRAPDDRPFAPRSLNCTIMLDAK